jgi:ribose transport system permease protein
MTEEAKVQADQRVDDPRKRTTIGILGRIGILPVLIVIAVAVFGYGNPLFLGHENLVNILQQSVYLLLIALGQMMVLVSGGFDLSVGATVALTSIVSSMVMLMVGGGSPDASFLVVGIGAIAAIAIGALAGTVNAIGVSILRVNPFIVTLATASIFEGVTMLLSQGMEISGLPDFFVYTIGSGRIAGIPISVIFAVPTALIVYLIVDWTRFGRYLYATGSNPRATFVAGISVTRVLFMTYVGCGVITALSGFILTARVSSGQPLLGAEFPLQSIAAAVIGGCSLKGGQGTVGGTVLGVLFVTVVANGMDLLRLGSNFQLIALGVVLAGAVLLDRRQSAT